MATGEQILSYPGSGGLGSNANIPVSYGKPLDFVNETIRDIGLRDAQKNMVIYQQKIRDRDKMLELLDSGEIKVGDTLKNDLPVVQKAIDNQTQAFTDWMKKGVGDVQGAMAYKKATQDARDATTQAQARKKMYDEEQKNIGSEKLPKFAEARKQNLQKNLSDFWADWTPYQQFQSLDIDPITKFAQPITTVLPEDNNHPYQKGKRTYVSYNDALKNAQNYGLTPEGQYNLETFHSTLQDMSPLELGGKIRQTNIELARYNKERGLRPGDPDYVTPIQAVPQVGQDGKMTVGLNEPLPSLAAKFSLAQHPNYQIDQWDVDKNKIDIGELNEKARHNRAQEAIDRSQVNFKNREFDDKIARLGTPGQVAESAKTYAKSLMTKLNLLKDENGVVSKDKLKNLTSDELKFMGFAQVKDGKFTLTPLDPTSFNEIKLNDDGTMNIVSTKIDKDKKETKDTVGTLDVSQIATNKIGEEMTLTSGKESFNYNSLIDLYGPKKEEPTVTVKARVSKKPVDRKGFTQNEGDWTKEGNYWKYKDGRYFDAEGYEVK